MSQSVTMCDQCACTSPECLQELLLPLVTDTDISMEISGFAALALGLVFTSTCKEVCDRSLAWGGGLLQHLQGTHTSPPPACIWCSNSYSHPNSPRHLLFLLQDIVMAILQALMCRSEADLDSPFAKYLCLALGLLFLGKQDVVEATLEVSTCPQGRSSSHVLAQGQHMHGAEGGSACVLALSWLVPTPPRPHPAGLQDPQRAHLQVLPGHSRVAGLRGHR